MFQLKEDEFIGLLMNSRPLSRNLLTTLIVVVITLAGLYWWFQSRSTPKKSELPDSETTEASEIWRNVQLEQTISDAVSRTKWITALVISPDGTHLISGADDQTVKIWELETGRLIRTLRGHSDAISSVAISPDGKRIASSSDDKTVKLWDFETGNLLQTFEEFMLDSSEAKPDSSEVEPDSSKAKPDSSEVKLVAFPDNQTLIAVGHRQNPDNDEQTIKTIERWIIEKEYKRLDPLTGGLGKVRAAAFDLKEQLVAIASEESNRVDLWHLGSNKKLTSLRGRFPDVQEIAFGANDDGQWLAISGNYTAVELWHLTIKKPNDLQRFLRIKESINSQEKVQIISAATGIIDSLAFSPDGQTLFAGSRDRSVKIWNISNGDLIRILKGNSSWVEEIAISSDGKTLVTGSTLGEIKTWQPSSKGLTVSQEVAENVRKLRSSRQCRQCNLNGADLRNYSLGEVDLQWANLSEALLNGVDLNRANLQDAILFKADLQDANLSDANLSGANLEKANLSDANLEGANFGGTNLKDAKLKGTIMSETKVENKVNSPEESSYE
ncbi:MAG: pentapeptide repeat-containing protein [Coleofasciculus sp. E2-BRE-01]